MACDCDCDDEHAGTSLVESLGHALLGWAFRGWGRMQGFVPGLVVLGEADEETRKEF